MKLSRKIMLSNVAIMTILVLVACGNGSNQTQSSQTTCSTSSQVSSASSTSSSVSSSANSTSSSSQTTVASTELDGTYTATHEGDQLTLKLVSGKGTLTKVERDGDQEIEQVEIDTTNQKMTIGDDVHRYYVNGNQLTVEDIDQEVDQDDTIVFTKQ